MVGEWALPWSLLVVVVADTEDAQWERPQVRYLPHGIQLPKAPYPARRNLGPVQEPQPFGPTEGLQLFGDPLPGDNLTSLTRIPNDPGMQLFGPRHRSQQNRAEGFGPYEMPNEHDLLALDEPLVARQALGPPPPSVDLTHLVKISDPRIGPFRSGQSAYGFPPPRPFDQSHLSQTGQGLEAQQMLGGDRAMNPWYGLPVPTPMGPYYRKLKPKPKPMAPPVEFKPPLSPLRDIDDPKKRTSRVPKPYDSWQGAQERGLVPPPPPAPEQFAPLAPPRMRPAARNAKHLRQGGSVKRQDSPENILTMLSHVPRFHELPRDKDPVKPSTRWQYQYAAGGSPEEASSKPPPALLSQEDGIMEELSPDSNDAELFSNAAKPAKPRPPLKNFDYMLL